MSLISIPRNLQEWDIFTLNLLSKVPDIESETFDFKREPNNIHKHICAMANSRGGFLVLGFEEERKTASVISGFRKVGFPNGEQDRVQLKIANSISNIEPLPNVIISHIQEGVRFFTIVQIKEEKSKKPFFLRDTGQCYVRVLNSSRRISLNTIFHFF